MSTNNVQALLAASVVAVVLAMPTPSPAGWRADCRAAARACRKSRGATTTIPQIACGSPNCHGHCIMVNGQLYVSMFDALNGLCSLPMQPDCSLCSGFCSSTTTSTMAASTTTSTAAP